MPALPLAVQTLPLIVVLALVLATLVLTAYAAARNKDTGDHYVAGRRIGGLANGLALAGDQISAASFLGITGAIALTGFNGFYLAVGLPIAYVLVLLLVAEPLRNLGRFTLADVVSVRFEGRGLRASIALATVIMTVIYMTVQFIGAGLIAGALLDVDFTVAVVVLGVDTAWEGDVVVEVSTRKGTRDQRDIDLAESLAFARFGLLPTQGASRI